MTFYFTLRNKLADLFLRESKVFAMKLAKELPIKKCLSRLSEIREWDGEPSPKSRSKYLKKGAFWHEKIEDIVLFKLTGMK